MAGVSQENVEIARKNAEAYARKDNAEALRYISEEVVYDITRNSPEGAVFHGYDGLAEGLRLWLDMWKDFELEVTEVIDVGPNKVVVGSRQRGRGRGSQVPSESEVYWVDTIEDGKIVRFDVCPDKETALETAGAGG